LYQANLQCVTSRKVLFMAVCVLDEGQTVMIVFVDSANNHGYFQSDIMTWFHDALRVSRASDGSAKNNIWTWQQMSPNKP
ncbi:hypothetical protein KUCAC02_019604, partial [Chaenocephalus aceratus]